MSAFENVFKSQMDTHSPESQQNYAHHIELKERYLKLAEHIKLGGGLLAVEKHRARKKWMARERIEAILDPGSPFLELSLLAAHDVYEDDVPAASVITGIGKVHGRDCMFVANDATVKGGTYYPLTVKKHLRAQEIARENSLPCIYIVDSGGAYLPLQAEVFPDREHFGRIFYNQAQMSSEGIPQIAVVCGPCTAGGAYVPAMSDETIIVKEQGTIFLGGPPLVRAATGENVTAEELGGADVHTRLSGVADHFAEDEVSAFKRVREIFQSIPPAPSEWRQKLKIKEARPPLGNAEELYHIIPHDSRRPFDIKEILARLVDGGELIPFKERYGESLICAFAHLGGMPIGIIANNGILFSESAVKGAHFIELCCQRNVPLLFVQNITGFMVGKQYEHEGIAKHGAKLVTAVSTARVPKITLVVGGSYGAGNYGMCGRAYSPRFLFMWPNAKISVMGGEQAARVLSTVKEEALEKKGQTLSAEEREKIEAPILKKYAVESDVTYSSARLWDDGVILPEQTRECLIYAFQITLNGAATPTRFGIFRM
jgi:3-methylcrotonyl-CoA carboxylase beta subunit